MFFYFYFFCSGAALRWRNGEWNSPRRLIAIRSNWLVNWRPTTSSTLHRQVGIYDHFFSITAKIRWRGSHHHLVDGISLYKTKEKTPFFSISSLSLICAHRWWGSGRRAALQCRTISHQNSAAPLRRKIRLMMNGEKMIGDILQKHFLLFFMRY
jgi:hypothetical protein